MSNYKYFDTCCNISSTYISTMESCKANFDVVEICYLRLINKDIGLKDRNKYLILFIQTHLREKNFEVLNTLIGRANLNGLHISLLKGMLIMTDFHEDLTYSHGALKKYYQERIEHPN